MARPRPFEADLRPFEADLRALLRLPTPLKKNIKKSYLFCFTAGKQCLVPTDSVSQAHHRNVQKMGVVQAGLLNLCGKHKT